MSLRQTLNHIIAIAFKSDNSLSVIVNEIEEAKTDLALHNLDDSNKYRENRLNQLEDQYFRLTKRKYNHRG